MFTKISKYLLEMQAELRKATWPWDPKEKGFKKYKKLSDSTLVVCVAMLLLGAYVAFGDLVLRQVVLFLVG